MRGGGGFRVGCSAATAEIALIVGYVGASHISPDAQDAHAESLLRGSKSRNGVGADIVIRDMEDLPTIINYFLDLKLDKPDACKRPLYDFSTVQPQLIDRCWTKAGKSGVPEAEDANPR